jgi:ABC-type branched-subunit amino acid transport system substrate-binding protein
MLMWEKSLLLATAMLFSLSSQAADEQRAFTIGYATDLTGKAAFLGKQSQAGAQLAARELQAAGIRVRVIFEDHRTDPMTGVSAVRKLLTADKAEAILCDTTPPCLAVAPILEKAKKLMLYQAPVISIAATSPYAFRTFLDYEDGCRRIAEYWRSRGIERVGHIKLNTEFGELCLKGAQSVFPAQIVFPYDTTNDVKPFLMRFKSDGVQAVFQTGYEADFLARIRASSELRAAFLASIPKPLMTPAVLEAAKAGGELDTLISFGFQAVPPEFEERLRAAGLFIGTNNIESALIGWSNVHRAVAAIRSCPTDAIECQAGVLQKEDSERTLGFLGWSNRSAVYDYALQTAAGNAVQ